MDQGVIVDVETTGLDAGVDKIIEIGILEFCVEGDTTPIITGCYGALEDPGRPLGDEIVKLTGLTDSVLAGRSIDWSRVRVMLEQSAIVIAHNAAFDASFIKARPELTDLDLHWACSLNHLPWSRWGMNVRGLTYLAADHGFVNPFAHRAIFDCATTFRLVAPHMRLLAERSWLKNIEVAARNAPFDAKDRLRLRGYRWDNEQRVWRRRFLEDELQGEREFLKVEVYKGAEGIHEEIILPGIW